MFSSRTGRPFYFLGDALIEDYKKSEPFKKLHQDIAKRARIIVRHDIRYEYPNLDLTFLETHLGPKEDVQSPTHKETEAQTTPKMIHVDQIIPPLTCTKGPL